LFRRNLPERKKRKGLRRKAPPGPETLVMGRGWKKIQIRIYVLALGVTVGGCRVKSLKDVP